MPPVVRWTLILGHMMEGMRGRERGGGREKGNMGADIISTNTRTPNIANERKSAGRMRRYGSI